MKIIPVNLYVCEKCGYYNIDDKNAQEVREHEAKPITGICPSLDGLIVKKGYKQDYLVFRRLPLASFKHEALYAWECYLRQSLAQESSGLPKELEESLDKLLSSMGVRDGSTAAHIVDAVLHTSGSESGPERFKDYDQLTDKEFQRVTSRLRRKYPDKYAKTEFKQELKYRRSRK